MAHPTIERARRRAALLLAGSGLSIAGACKDGTPPAPPPDVRPSAVATGAPVASGTLAADAETNGDAIRPVYPVDNLPPLPLAEQYCNAVRETPRKRRDECCPSIGAFAPTAECIRTLSAALRSGAVTLEKADVDACAAAVVSETAGCDWVTSVGSPTFGACLGIIHGTVKDGEVCRSNLECEEGKRCVGLGAVRSGRCAPPPQQGVCNIGTDSLAVFMGQDDFERHHPECAGYCAHRQCREATAVGAACAASGECGPVGTCVAGKCAEGPRPGPRRACTDLCAAGARCSKGTCVELKAGGERCGEDAECRGQCVRTGGGGKTGVCGPSCPSFPISPKPWTKAK